VGVGIFIAVSHENIGRPVLGVRLESGYPNTFGVLPGASGAQLIGKLIQPPHPNPQLRPLARFSAIVDITFSALGSNPISRLLLFVSVMNFTTDDDCVFDGVFV